MAEESAKISKEQINRNLGQIVLYATKSAVEKVCEIENVPAGSSEAAQTCVAAAVSALTVLALCICKCVGKDCDKGVCCEDPMKNRITNSTLHFAALVVANAIDAVKPGESIRTDVGTNSIIEAVAAFKKLNDGADPEKFLDPALVHAMHQSSDGSEDLVADFLKGLNKDKPSDDESLDDLDEDSFDDLDE